MVVAGGIARHRWAGDGVEVVNAAGQAQRRYDRGRTAS